MTATEPVPPGANFSDEWASYGLCNSVDPDSLFVAGKAQREAKLVCRGCPVIARCLAEALDNRTEFGVWGGMTERERRALLRRQPNVQSWSDVLMTGAGEGLPPGGDGLAAAAG